MHHARSPASYVRQATAIGALALAACLPGSAQAAMVRQPDQRAITSSHELCDSDRVKEAVSLVYEYDRIEQAQEIALRCEAPAEATARPFSRTVATRIKAVIAMRLRDMRSLKRAGEFLVAQALVPEYVADGHMFIAFACVFGGDTSCARHHVDTARHMFTELRIADALAQLQPIEQTLARLEAQGERP